MPDKEIITVWDKKTSAAYYFNDFKFTEYTPSEEESLLDCFTRALSETYINEKKSVVFIVCSDDVFSKKLKCSEAENIVNISKDECSWEFVFIGPDVNASIIAGSLGIEKLTAVRYGRNTDSLKAACGLAIKYM